MNAAPTIAVLAGDGIGPEVTDAALEVLDAVGFEAEYVHAPVGWTEWCERAEALPEATLSVAREADAVLFGAITSQPAAEAEAALAPHLRGQGHRYRSPILRLRQELGLHTNLRPTTFWPGAPSPLATPPEPRSDGTPFRITVIRENTEGLYAGCEVAEDDHERLSTLRDLWPHARALNDPEGAAVTLRVVTRRATMRLAEAAFAIAAVERHDHVVLAEKPNVLRETGRLVTEAFRDVGHARAETGITLRPMNLDALATDLVLHPKRYPVIAATNLFGDVLSDLVAGLAGGLGLAPSANLGDRHALFEPVHGSAPDIAGRGVANPTAAILAAAHMVRHLGDAATADAIEAGVAAAVADETVRTPDLGGQGDTTRMTRAIIQGAQRRLGRERPVARVG